MTILFTLMRFAKMVRSWESIVIDVMTGVRSALSATAVLIVCRWYVTFKVNLVCTTLHRTPSQIYRVSFAKLPYDHSVTRHPSQVNTPRVNRNQTGLNSINQHRRKAEFI